MGKKWEIISKSAAATVCSGKIVGEGQVGKDILLKLFSGKERIKKIRAKKKWKGYLHKRSDRGKHILLRK